jgi:hypothetical protein
MIEDRWTQNEGKREIEKKKEKTEGSKKKYIKGITK